MVPNYNLDTRRDRVAVSVDLNDCPDVVPLVTFDAPDDLRVTAPVSVVSGDAGMAAHNIGWLHGVELVQELPLSSGGQVTLAVTRDWLAGKVALLRAHGTLATAAVVDVPFATVLQMPRGPRASPKRVAQISVRASASRPAAQLVANPVNLDGLPPAAADLIATFTIDIPVDIAFELNRVMAVDVSCASIAPDTLLLEPGPGLLPLASIRRGTAPSTGAARFLIALMPGEDIGGQALTLQLMLKREALLSIIDVLLAPGAGKSPGLLVTARLSGWGDGNANLAAGTPDRRWVMPIPALTIPVVSASLAKVIVATGNSTFTAVLDEPPAAVLDGQPLVVEFDPESTSEIARFPGLKFSISRWPLGRSADVTIAIVGHLAGETIAEVPTIVQPGIDQDIGTVRQVQAMLPLRATVSRLTQMIRSGLLSPANEDLFIALRASTGDQEFLSIRLPLRLVRSVSQLPICIDLGASAISIWAGAPRPRDQPFDIQPLSIGTWLAQNIDANHLEANADDGEAALLIPSHVSLDPMNHLRSDHAPHTLDGLSLVGPDREAARLRMKHFGRRYDVSVPGPPPVGRSRQSGRRIKGLKHALTTGQLVLPVSEPVNRYDSTHDKVSTTTAVEVMSLVADVLDELVDFYVMRLGQLGSNSGAGNSAPVMPRVIVTCPSGIGNEVRLRYEAALGLFSQRLERLFPGASARDDAARTLPEAVAAARYVAELLANHDAVAGIAQIVLITADLGASSSDVAIARIGFQSGRVSAFETLSTFGIPIGGDAIDQALTEIICNHADHFFKDHRAHWAATFDSPDLARAIVSQEPSCLAAERWLSANLRLAKSRLTTITEAEAKDSNGPYVWRNAGDEGSSFDVVLAENTDDEGWQGLYQPLGPVSDSRIELAAGVVICIETSAAERKTLVLKLSRDAVMRDSGTPSRVLAQTTHALGTLLQRMARAVVPISAERPHVMIVPTGRAALWPPLFEEIVAEAARGRDALPFARPLAPTIMKKAVAAGAALLGERRLKQEDWSLYTCPLGLAVMGLHLTEQRSGALRTSAVAERIFYLSYDMAGADRSFNIVDESAPSLASRGDLGMRFQFVRAVPGLDPLGRTLAQLRTVLNHQDPMVLLEGDIVVDAATERIDHFGLCEIISCKLPGGIRQVTIAAGDSNWEGSWQIEGSRVTRVY